MFPPESVITTFCSCNTLAGQVANAEGVSVMIPESPMVPVCPTIVIVISAPSSGFAGAAVIEFTLFTAAWVSSATVRV